MESPIWDTDRKHPGCLKWLLPWLELDCKWQGINFCKIAFFLWAWFLVSFQSRSNCLKLLQAGCRWTTHLFKISFDDRRWFSGFVFLWHTLKTWNIVKHIIKLVQLCSVPAGNWLARFTAKRDCSVREGCASSGASFGHVIRLARRFYTFYFNQECDYKQ